MRKLYVFLVILSCINNAFSQTNPSVQTIPYSQDFSLVAHSSTTYPPGWQGWTIATAPGAIFNTVSPIADRVLVATSGASTTSGNVHNYNGKLGFLNTGSLDLTLALALDGTGKSNIQVSYDIMTIRNPHDGTTNTRINEVTLQYRVGTSGAFTTLSGIEYQNNTTLQTGAGVTAPQNLQTKTISLPAACDNQPIIQLRWASRQVSGAGARPSFALDNLTVTETGGPVLPTIAITSSVNPAEPATNGSFTITLSAPTPTDIPVNYTIGGTATANTDYTGLSGTAIITATNSSIVIPVSVLDDLVSDLGETIIITLQTVAGYTLGSPSSVTLTIADDDFATTNIGTIQGTGSTATPGNFGIDAIVTAVYPAWSPAGFYVQEADATADADPLTSNGIFVVSTATVAVGNRIKLFGAVQEDNLTPSFRQAVIIPSILINLSSGNALPAPANVSLPVTASLTELEPFEGMLVQLPYTLTVTDNADLGSFGEVRLSRNGFVYQPTQIIDPNDNPAVGTNTSGSSNVAAVTAYNSQNLFRTILLDDGRNGIPLSLPYVDANNTLRVGSTITNLTGVLGFGFSNYRILPLPSGHPSGPAPSFSFAARPASPPAVGGATIKVVSFNIQNFFNGDGAGGGFPTARGANSLAEYVRQRDKLVEALFLLDADVYGLVEVENDGTGPTSAIAQLVNAFNTRAGVPGLYAFINDAVQPLPPTGDEIRNTIIYKTTSVTTVGLPMIDLNAVHNRPPVIQTFNVTGVNKTFNLAVIHHKSKRCGGSTGLDTDQGDGQACFNETRKNQTTALLNFITTTVIPTSGTNSVIVVGDYNAYTEEDPIDMMRAAGYNYTGTNTDVSYNFDGQLGALDHAMITSSLVSTITGIGKWSINSTEPAYLGYEDNIQSGGETINPWSSTYTVSPWATSDHDPVVIGLLFSATLPVEFGNFTVTKAGNKAKINWNTLQELNSSHFEVERSADSRTWTSIHKVNAAGTSSTVINYEYIDPLPAKGRNYYRIRQIDLNGTAKTTDIKAVDFNSPKSISFFPNPANDQLTVQSGGTQIYSIRIIDSKGQVVLQNNVNQTTTHLNLKQMKAGLYILQLMTNEGMVTERFIKQ